MDVAARLEAVERENELLRAEIARLERALMGDTLPPLELGLTPGEARVFGMLMQRNCCSKDALMAVLYRDLGKDEAQLKIVDVYICKLRRKLKPFGIAIRTHWGEGYSLSAESKRVARELAGAEAKASSEAA